MLRNIFAREEGQGLVEYALIIALVAIALVATLSLMADPVNGIFGRIIASLNNVSS